MKVPLAVGPGAPEKERFPCNSAGSGSYSLHSNSALSLSTFSSGNKKGNCAFVRKFTTSNVDACIFSVLPTQQKLIYNLNVHSG